MKHITVNRILWLIFLSLLAVLLPHTAWAFGQFEPALTRWVTYPAAFAFEAAIAALIHKLAKHIENTPKRKGRFAKFAYRYLNAYALGLLVAIGISSLANLAHAVEFGQPMKIFSEWGVPFAVYALAFGAILPMVSLVFALVLSNATEAELEDDPALTEAKNTIIELRRKAREAEQKFNDTLAEMNNKYVHEYEARTQAEQRFAAMGDLFVRLMSEEKREKILAASQLWPELPGKAIAIIADSTPSYVSEVLAVTK